jgi:hypothetical protein
MILALKTGQEKGVVEWLTVLHRIRDVPDSNLGQDTGYPG